MANFPHVQTNFTAGELSPRLLGRTDLSRYHNGLRESSNILIQPHGPALARSGFRHIQSARYANRRARLIPFRFSTEQAYILEFGHQYVRFYRDGGALMSGGSPYQITSPYTEAQLPLIRYTQSADILYLCHPEHRPQQLERHGDTNWQFVDFPFRDGPYEPQNIDRSHRVGVETGPPWEPGDEVVLTSNKDLWQASDVGRAFRHQRAGNQWGWGIITAYENPRRVTLTLDDTSEEPFWTDNDNTSDPDKSTTSWRWRLGAWSSEKGWPWAVGFHQERLWFGGRKDLPQTLWASAVGDFVSFLPSERDGVVADDSGLTFTLSDDRVNAIHWLASSPKGLLVGTAGGEFLVRAQSAFDPVSPTNVGAFRQSTYGSHPQVPPAHLGSVVLFANPWGRVLREMAFDFEQDQYLAPDLTLLAEHITLPGITDLAYRQEPGSILWMARGDGALLGMTYERDQEVVAWHRHAVADGKGHVEALATIPGEEGDELWAIIRYELAQGSRRYVERLEPDFGVGSLQEDAFFLDSGLTYAGSPTTTIAGLDHLEGETVSILADGGTHPDRLVTGGQITLQAPASKVHVGLRYTPRLRTLPIMAEIQGRTTQGRTGRIYKALLHFYRSLGVRIETPDADPEELIFRAGSDPQDQAPPLFTGVRQLDVRGIHHKELELTVTQPYPLPMQLISIVHEIRTGGV